MIPIDIQIDQHETESDTQYVRTVKVFGITIFKERVSTNSTIKNKTIGFETIPDETVWIDYD